MSYQLAPIHSEAQYDQAMNMLETLWGSEEGTQEHDTLCVLSMLISHYEEEQCPVEPLTPIEAVEGYMDLNGLEQKDLAVVMGSKARASEFLAGKRDLSISQVKAIRAAWGISADMLIEPPLPIAV
ncbi:MAG: helix-turn-helix domain-containing protein [Terasakiella sp.]|uniref:helix-turn-helix domain-containing protein n=1 Tax=unclassified Terasakiella TaxID=2614952 RepID=UPI003AFFBFD9